MYCVLVLLYVPIKYLSNQCVKMVHFRVVLPVSFTFPVFVVANLTVLPFRGLFISHPSFCLSSHYRVSGKISVKNLCFVNVLFHPVEGKNILKKM